MLKRNERTMTVDKGGKAVREEEWGKRWKGLKLWTGKREKFVRKGWSRINGRGYGRELGG